MDPSNSNILVIDDTLKNIQVLGAILREQGYLINAAQNGLQALQMVEEVPPDLILLDIMMPELDGFETCRRLKANEDTRDIPVIFLTAKVETEDVVRGFELGAVDYVTKPFNATELLRRVETHLELSKLQKDLERQVQERTEELREAHRQLQHRVRELDGRDRLVHAQMRGVSLDEEIVQVVADVLDVPRVRLYRAVEGALRAGAALGLAGDGVIQRADDLRQEAPAGGDVAATFADGKPRHNGQAAAVPILYDDEALGVIEVVGLEGDDDRQQEAVEVLWRLAREAALVCHTVERDEDLESGDLDVSALLDVNED